MRRPRSATLARLAALSRSDARSPHDAHLLKAVTDALDQKVRFYLAEPRLVEAALQKIYPETKETNA